MRTKETLVQFESKSSGLYTPPSSSLDGRLVLFMEVFTRPDFFGRPLGLCFRSVPVRPPSFVVRPAAFDVVLAPFPVAPFLRLVGLFPVLFVVEGHLCTFFHPFEVQTGLAHRPELVPRRLARVVQRQREVGLARTTPLFLFFVAHEVFYPFGHFWYTSLNFGFFMIKTPRWFLSGSR